MKKITIHTTGYRLFNGTEILLGTDEWTELGISTENDVREYEIKLANEFRKSIPSEDLTFINFERDDLDYCCDVFKCLGIAGIIQIHTGAGVRYANKLAAAMGCFFDTTIVCNIEFTSKDIGKTKILLTDDERYSLCIAKFNMDDLQDAINHVMHTTNKVEGGIT